MIRIQSQLKENKLGSAPDYLGNLWPFTLGYYSEYTTIFVGSIENLSELDNNKSYLVRDGFIGLMWFFNTFPSPESFKGKLFVHQEHQNFIPPEWIQHIGFYSLRNSNHYSSNPNPQKLIIIGCVNSSYCSDDFAESTLNAIQAMKNIETIHLYIITRHFSYATPDFESYPVHFFSRIFNKLKNFDIKIENHQFFDMYSSLRDHWVLDLNSRFLLGDNYLLHNCLSRGAMMAPTNSPNISETKFYPLSPYYGISLNQDFGLTKPLDFKSIGLADSISFFERFRSSCSREMEVSGPWPDWFPHWCRSIKKIVEIESGFQSTELWPFSNELPTNCTL